MFKRPWAVVGEDRFWQFRLTISGYNSLSVCTFDCVPTLAFQARIIIKMIFKVVALNANSRLPGCAETARLELSL
jgi:hypothetical protein